MTTKDQAKLLIHRLAEWVSICSVHRETNQECAACNNGYYGNVNLGDVLSAMEATDGPWLEGSPEFAVLARWRACGYFKSLQFILAESTVEHVLACGCKREPMLVGAAPHPEDHDDSLVIKMTGPAGDLFEHLLTLFPNESK